MIVFNLMCGVLGLLAIKNLGFKPFYVLAGGTNTFASLPKHGITHFHLETSDSINVKLILIVG